MSIGEKIKKWAKSSAVNLQGFELMKAGTEYKGEIVIYLVDASCGGAKSFKATEAWKRLGTEVASLAYGSKCSKCGKAIAVVIRME